MDSTWNVEDKLWVNANNLLIKFLGYLKPIVKDHQVFKLSFVSPMPMAF